MKALTNLLVGVGPLGLFLIAVVDGVGVPIPVGVDFLLVFLAAKNPDQAYLYAALSIIGSLLGGMGLYYAARKGGEAYLLKFTASGRGEKFKFWFLEYGLLTVFIPALVIIPLPLKVAEICAGALGVRPSPFFFTLLGARIPRYLALAYLGARLGEGSWPWVKAHGWHMGIFGVALFAVLYLMTLIVHRRRTRVA
ncbi:MAG TPA: VTT domain-containing protein [Bryobacteraceae bacterium]|jgi:membrane protein YqaA with SNARE-associated domain